MDAAIDIVIINTQYAFTSGLFTLSSLAGSHLLFHRAPCRRILFVYIIDQS